MCKISGTRISLYCAEILKLHSFQLRITLQDVLELTDMVSAMAAMEAESVEPHEEIRARDPLSLEQPQKMSVACSIELDGITLQILAPRPVLEFGLGASWGKLYQRCPAKNDVFAGSKPFAFWCAAVSCIFVLIL